MAVATLVAVASLIISIVALSNTKQAQASLFLCECDTDDLRLEIWELRQEIDGLRLEMYQLDTERTSCELEITQEIGELGREVLSHGREITRFQADRDQLREQIKGIGLILLKMMSGQRPQ